jgi:hypothetical protein
MSSFYKKVYRKIFLGIFLKIAGGYTTAFSKSHIETPDNGIFQSFRTLR